jgi:hypothetical protein
VWVHSSGKPFVHRTKFSRRARPGRFLGFEQSFGSGIYRVLLDSGEVTQSQTVVFDDAPCVPPPALLPPPSPTPMVGQPNDDDTDSDSDSDNDVHDSSLSAAVPQAATPANPGAALPSSAPPAIPAAGVPKAISPPLPAPQAVRTPTVMSPETVPGAQAGEVPTSPIRGTCNAAPQYCATRKYARRGPQASVAREVSNVVGGTGTVGGVRGHQTFGTQPTGARSASTGERILGDRKAKSRSARAQARGRYRRAQRNAARSKANIKQVRCPPGQSPVVEQTDCGVESRRERDAGPQTVEGPSQISLESGSPVR